MGNRRLHKIERFYALGTPESERLDVTALNLFHLTASPLLRKVSFFILRNSFKGDEVWSIPIQLSDAEYLRD